MVAPKLRFKGFSQNWFKISLSSVGEVVTGNTPATSEKKYYGDDFLWVSPADIKNQKLVNDTQTKLSILGVEKTRKIPNGSILVTCIGSTIGKIAMSGKELSTNQQINSLIPNSPNLKDFIYYSIECYIPLLKKLTATQAVPIINKSEFSNFKIPFTSENEAIKIGELFSNLDIRIQLQQEKINLLKEQKKGFMQKIFSQELRFKDEDGQEFPEWELLKLKQIAEVYDGTHQTPNYKSFGVKFLSVENIKTLNTQKYISTEDFNRNFKIAPKQGDILMTRIGDIGTSNIIKTNESLAYYVSLALIKCTEKVDSQYLNQYISSELFQRELHKRTLHVAFPKKINMGEIGNCLVNLPNLKEQIKIKKVLEPMEITINLNVQKLEELKKQKKAFIQKMFI